MSLQQTAEGDYFGSYREAVECFEQMSTMFGMPHHLINETARLRLLETCFQKLQTLIYIELDLNILSGDDFSSDVCTSLVLLREQVIQLTNAVQNSIFTKPHFNSIIPPVRSVQPVQQKSNIVQNPRSGEDDQLRQIIENTQVVPRVRGFADIAGLTSLKKTLTAVVILPMKQPQLYTGHKICNSILLYGPPGTGKTQIAHALAAESSSHLYSVTSSDILCKFVGQTEKMVRVLFQTVKQTRDNCTILFMDEIDGLCKQRSDNENEWTRRNSWLRHNKLSLLELHRPRNPNDSVVALIIQQFLVKNNMPIVLHPAYSADLAPCDFFPLSNDKNSIWCRLFGSHRMNLKKLNSELLNSLKTELMCQLSNFEDCRNIFLICATNCPWDLDPAFVRRFQQRIYVPLPERHERFELLKLFTKDMSLEIPSSVWNPLLNKTEGYSGSDLADLVRYAANTPLTELIGTKLWEPIGNNMYRPTTGSPSLFTKCCEFSEMPMCSIQARPVNIDDLMAAAGVVNRTISSANLQKYEEFVNKG